MILVENWEFQFLKKLRFFTHSASKVDFLSKRIERKEVKQSQNIWGNVIQLIFQWQQKRTKKTCLWFVLSIWSSEVSEKNPSFSIIKGWLWDYFPCLVDFVQWSFWHFLFFLKNDSEWRKILWLILFYQKKDIHLNENFTRGWILPWRRFVILTESSIIHMVFQSKLMQLSDSRGIKKNSPTYSIPTDNSPFKKIRSGFFVEKKFFQINNF